MWNERERWRDGFVFVYSTRQRERERRKERRGIAQIPRADDDDVETRASIIRVDDEQRVEEKREGRRKFPRRDIDLFFSLPAAAASEKRCLRVRRFCT